MDIILNQISIIGWNYINAIIDSKRINRDKKIYHWLNGLLYILFVFWLLIVGESDIFEYIIFCISSFCNRQLFFDIPLNVMRGLNWDYVTKDDDPSITDKIEIRLFGYNGKATAIIYFLMWIITILLNILVK